MDSFKRTFVAGKVETWHCRTNNKILAPLWIEVKYQDGEKGRLSITGVHGPMNNGNAHGSCGQCTDTLLELIDGPEDRIAIKAQGLTAKETAERLSTIWRDWHLNDMRAHCDHQLAVHKWDLSEQLTIWKWELHTDQVKAKNEIEASAKRRLLDGQEVSYTEAELALLRKEYWVWTQENQAPGPDYSLYGQKTERACRLYPIEQLGKDAFHTAENCHPKGLLTKPCPTCGHPWGSAWLHKQVPDEVLQFLFSLPDNLSEYPWRR